MAGEQSTQEPHVPDGQCFWEELALKLLHPTQLLIIEAIWWIEEPLSATLLQEVYDYQIGLSLLSYHCKRLEKLEVLEKVGEIPVRGASEKLFELVDRSGMKRA